MMNPQPATPLRPLAGTIAMLVGSLVVLSAAQPLDARPHADVRHVPVRFADIDVATLAGRATLAKRVHRAVRIACAVDDPRDLRSLGAHRQCVADARMRARVEIAAILQSRPVYAAAAPSAALPSPTESPAEAIL